MRKVPKFSREAFKSKFLLIATKREPGMETAEWIALTAVLTLTGCVILLYFGIIPNPFGFVPAIVDFAIPVAMLTFVVAGIGFSVKQFLTLVHNRTQLLILEVLSDGKPRTRQEIKEILRKMDRIFRLPEVELDALAELTLNGKVRLDNKRYTIANQSKSQLKAK